MACQRSVPVRLDTGRPAAGIQGPGVVPARAAWRRSARRLNIPADGTSTRRRPTPHPETRWTALALACPGGSVDGISRRQPSHRATRLPINRYHNDHRGALTSSQRWVQGFTVRSGARVFRCRPEPVKAPGPGCGSHTMAARPGGCAPRAAPSTITKVHQRPGAPLGRLRAPPPSAYDRCSSRAGRPATESRTWSGVPLALRWVRGRYLPVLTSAPVSPWRCAASTSVSTSSPTIRV